MSILLTNTLTGKKEEFVPIKQGKVGMYNCGPTVYNYAHIGNLRAYIFADTLRRAFLYAEFDVKQVINITDIGHLASDGDEGEDKMTKALKRKGKPLTLEAMREIADFYFQAFKNDLAKLNIKTPEHFPFASEHIKEDIELILKLTEKGFTYSTNDGIYFDTTKMADYGKLGGVATKSEEHSRIGINPEKKNSKDFAVWKFNSELGYEAPFGKGFPGWHIECSAMSMKYLGDTFDIHTGGIDHIPVHHNNEIAQSESATGKKFVNYWIHSAFVNFGESKMAKSEENFITLNSLIEHGIHPLSYRFWLLQAKYNSPVNFTWNTIGAVQNGFQTLLHKISLLPETDDVPDSEYISKFRKFIDDDLNTPEAIALLYKMLESNLPAGIKKSTITEFDKLLGLNLIELSKKLSAPDEIQKILEEIDELRHQKKFEESDGLRNSEKLSHYIVENTPNGTVALKRLTPDL